jgi:hypothetical protein
MIALVEVARASAAFLARCRGCRYAVGENKYGLPVCRYVAPAPPTAEELAQAATGAERTRPAIRNYAARIAALVDPTKYNGWNETWMRLDRPCQEFTDK